MIEIRNTRLKELDFLRGLAVTLVLFRHYYIFDFARTMGWIGVDLFFVLSGFLISSLLFKEYLRYGNVKPGLFLIRRGFKIYPLFYVAIGLTVPILLILKRPVYLAGVLGELFFLQNYVGSLWNHTWSLAVEEHFYFLTALILPLLIRYRLLEKHKVLMASFCVLFIAGLSIRICANLVWPERYNFFATHLRFDSLLAGVFISYLYYFRKDLLQKFFSKFRLFIFPAAFLMLSFTPLIEPLSSFFVKTIGLSLLYVAFSLVLIYFIAEPEMENKLNAMFGKAVVGMMSTIGFYSYSIYLFHMFVSRYFMVLVRKVITLPQVVNYIIYFIVSVLLGILVSRLIELPLLRLRDQYFPARSTLKK